MSYGERRLTVALGLLTLVATPMALLGGIALANIGLGIMLIIVISLIGWAWWLDNGSDGNDRRGA